jgi:hypothetical protein
MRERSSVGPLVDSTLADALMDEDKSLRNDGAELCCDERKIKEEIVLIGERMDIESLLDNQNNQLFNSFSIRITLCAWLKLRAISARSE